MSWVTPVTDRTQSDIDNLTSKAYFNVADWVRIYGNEAVIKAMLDANGYKNLPLTTLGTPTTSTIPSVSAINSLINNIEQLRISSCLDLMELEDGYEAGANANVPNFEDVNDWENNLLQMYEGIPKAVDYWVRCGVSACGQDRFWQNRFR